MLALLLNTVTEHMTNCGGFADGSQSEMEAMAAALPHMLTVKTITF